MERTITDEQRTTSGGRAFYRWWFILFITIDASLQCFACKTMCTTSDATINMNIKAKTISVNFGIKMGRMK